MARGKTYDEDFKKMIVELYNTKSKPACDIIREYGISNSVLYKWVIRLMIHMIVINRVMNTYKFTK